MRIGLLSVCDVKSCVAFRQLRKMSAGGFLAVIAGVLCGFLQLKVNVSIIVNCSLNLKDNQ